MASRCTTDPTWFRLLPLSLPCIFQKVRVVIIKLAKLDALLLYSWITFCFLLCLNTCATRLTYNSCFCCLCCIAMEM